MSYFTFAIEAVISYLHLSFQNWGWAILALALVIRVLLLPIQIFNFRQQKRLAKIQPELDQLSTLHKEDPMRLYKEMGEVKKRGGVRTGLTMISSFVQIPIFISVFKVFSSMQSLMSGSFAWVGSLASPDPLFIFPVLVAGTTYLQQKLNPGTQNAASAQMASVMKYMPLVSMAFMVTMPAGLVAYYAASGFIQLAGDFVIKRMS